MTGDRLARSAVMAAVAIAATAGTALAASEEGASPSIFAGDLGNVIWTMVTFIAVVLVLGKFAWPPILTALQRREEFIRESLAEAKRDREEAESRLKEVEDRLTTARSEATAIVEEGRRDADVLKRKIEQDARQEADNMIERARREINIARDTAVKDLYDLTAGLATEAARKIIQKEIDPATHERLIADSIDELVRGSGNGNN